MRVRAADHHATWLAVAIDEQREVDALCIGRSEVEAVDAALRVEVELDISPTLSDAIVEFDATRVKIDDRTFRDPNASAETVLLRMCR
jgi:hypothetical protein